MKDSQRGEERSPGLIDWLRRRRRDLLGTLPGIPSLVYSTLYSLPARPPWPVHGQVYTEYGPSSLRLCYGELTVLNGTSTARGFMSGTDNNVTF